MFNHHRRVCIEDSHIVLAMGGFTVRRTIGPVTKGKHLFEADRCHRPSRMGPISQSVGIANSDCEGDTVKGVSLSSGHCK